MKKRDSAGFSLIELIIAIAIAAVLTGLSAPVFMRYLEKSREAKDMETLYTIYETVQVALMSGRSYDDVVLSGDPYPEGRGLVGLTTTGICLNLLEKETVGISFRDELESSIGYIDYENPLSMWESKAVIDAGGNAAVYIMINKEWKSSVWIGLPSEGGRVVSEGHALSPTALMVNGKDIKTKETTFFISK